jgi:hypothetical protein
MDHLALTVIDKMCFSLVFSAFCGFRSYMSLHQVSIELYPVFFEHDSVKITKALNCITQTAAV